MRALHFGAQPLGLMELRVKYQNGQRIGKDCKMKKKKRIALVAHDQRKEDLLSWVEYNVDRLSKHELYATGTTGKIISEACSIDIHSVRLQKVVDKPGMKVREGLTVSIIDSGILCNPQRAILFSS
jgi:hypothetical protein